METQAEALLGLVRRAQATGAPADLADARIECQALSQALGGGPTLNDVLPTEILTLILDKVVFSDETATRSRWTTVRRVCKSWHAIAQQMDEQTGVVNYMFFRDKYALVEDLIRPFVQRLDAFKNLRAVSIPLYALPGQLGFDMVMQALRGRPRLRKLVFFCENPRAHCLKSQELKPNMWKGYRYRLRHMGIAELVLQGRFFASVGPDLSGFVTVGGSKTLTRLSMPNLGEYLGHLEFEVRTEATNVMHPICKKTSYLRKRKLNPFDLSSMECLETLELGSFDLRCTDCALYLPRNLKTLVIHRPDGSNLSIPENLHHHVRFNRLVLKHLGEGAFYWDGYPTLTPPFRFDHTEAERRFVAGLKKGRTEYIRMLKRQCLSTLPEPSNDGSMLDYLEPANIDRYEQYLLGLPPVRSVSIDQDDKCKHQPISSLSKPNLNRWGFRCWTVTIDLAVADRPPKRKTASGGGGGEAKKRKSAR